MSKEANKKQYQYTENDIMILRKVTEKGEKTKGLTLMHSSTMKEIIERTGLSEAKVRRTMKKFLEEGFVMYGVKKGITKTYCLTKEGIQKLYSLREVQVGSLK